MHVETLRRDHMICFIVDEHVCFDDMRCLERFATVLIWTDAAVSIQKYQMFIADVLRETAF